MAANRKLFYSFMEGSISAEEISTYLKERNVGVREVKAYEKGNAGTIIFQKKEDMDTALNTHESFNIGIVKVTLTSHNPKGGNPSSQKMAQETITVTPENQLRRPEPLLCNKPYNPPHKKFLNPYHFVDVSGFTPRYPAIFHDRFSHHCGKISVTIEFKSPGFIPDPEKTVFIISDQTLMLENDDQGFQVAFQDSIRKWLEKQNNPALPVEILFDQDIRGWNSNEIEKYIELLSETPSANGSKHVQGKICLNSSSGSYYILTKMPIKYAHKQMEFFSINGKPSLPSTSLRGMVRNVVETLSNSCFTGLGESDDADYVFHRLSTESDGYEIRGLQAVILKKHGNQWKLIRLQKAKVLSPHLFNRIGSSEINELGAYWNRSENYYEKLSHRGKKNDTYPNENTGLNAYDRQGDRGKNGRGDIAEISNEACISLDNFAVSEINGHRLTHTENKYNKTFPYVDDPFQQKSLWAIIRRAPGKKSFKLYKIKKISDDKENLKKALVDFVDHKKNPDSAKPNIKYAISEIKIKNSFDIDTKTQHQAFFVFGKENFDAAINDKLNNGQTAVLDNDTVNAFRSLLRQRKNNAEKIHSDKKNINKKLAENLRDDIYDGMLAYAYYNHGQLVYLTYTTVPQKPYRHNPYELIKSNGKLSCSNLQELCPACQMFGMVFSGSNKTHSGYKGKVTVGMGKLEGEIPDFKPVTLKPLSTPKPTYYPFYLLNNRRRNNTTQPPFRNYDNNSLQVGRKVYLHHHPEKLSFETDHKTNLNSTIHPVSSGTRFKFEIDFENLTDYELGLLLYSLDMKYKNKKTGYHLGMAKSLGLGSCCLQVNTVEIWDMKRHYTSIESRGVLLKPEEIKLLKLNCQHVQAAENNDEFINRQKITISEKIREEESAKIGSAYFKLPYAREYHILKSINIIPELTTKLPICFAGGTENEGFEWYKKAKTNQNQRLFHPDDFEAAITTNEAEGHALRETSG